MPRARAQVAPAAVGEIDRREEASSGWQAARIVRHCQGGAGRGVLGAVGAVGISPGDVRGPGDDLGDGADRGERHRARDRKIFLS